MITPVSEGESRFDSNWTKTFDVLLPGFLKGKFAAQEAWKKQPFDERDFRFFSKGVERLHESFTRDREFRDDHYFRDPKSRSAYFLYYLPHHAARFYSIFSKHEKRLAELLRKKDSVITDFGAGPGTASIALLLFCLEKKIFPKNLQFHWLDLNEPILKEGKELFLSLTKSLELPFPVRVRFDVLKFRQKPTFEDSKLLLLGNVLNEMGERSISQLDALLAAHSGDTIFLEPPEKRNSQLLSDIRNRLVQGNQTRIIGPCLHLGECPLSRGKDWCHASVNSRVPGKWYQRSSRLVSGGVHDWIKYSYLWVTRSEDGKGEASTHPPGLRRVLSDPMKTIGNPSEVLVCLPDQPGRVIVPKSLEKIVLRGTLVSVK